MKTGLVKKVDGIFVTHYHDDHTDSVQAAAKEFDCPVYATKEYEDILERPEAYHMPALTANPITDVKGLDDGHKMQWKEFRLRFDFYPGQTIYHGALLVKKPDERPVYLIGDAFSPSGMDDYCLLNRNLVHKDDGYMLCLKKIRELGSNYWLINEHIPFVFNFNNEELKYFETRYQARIDTLKELFPWDDPNYGIDEQWAVFYPHGMSVKANKSQEIEVRISNHSNIERTFRVKPHTAAGMSVDAASKEVTLKARADGVVKFTIQTPKKPGTYVITADVDSKGMHFRRWLEGVITVK